jgi:hypothetical protein
MKLVALLKMLLNGRRRRGNSMENKSGLACVNKCMLALAFVSMTSGLMATTWNYSNTTISEATQSMYSNLLGEGVQENHVINLDGTITVSGQIVFKTDDAKTLTINCGSTTPAIIQAKASYVEGTNALVHYDQASHLMFCPEDGGQIIVNLITDLYVTGSNYGPTVGVLAATTAANGADLGARELVMTFTGKGQTVFNLYDGKSIIFDSLYFDSPNFVETTSTGSGVSIYVAMDDTKANVETNGVNKVVFKRLAYTSGGSSDCSVEFALNSYMTYVSTNATGLDSTAQAYAAVAFDVSNEDKGRLNLKLTGPSASNTYVDGAINVCGQYLENGAGAAGTLTNGLHFRKYVNWSKQAGSVAYMRVIDEEAYKVSAYRTALDGDGNISGEPTRRGLLVKNTGKSIPAFAADPYADSGWYYQDIYGTSPYFGNVSNRPGFVLGINGHIEVFHNTFFEYEANTANSEFIPNNLGLSTLNTAITGAGFNDPGLVLKKHNGSAFIVDGLDDPTGGAPATVFDAHANAAVLRHAEITLLGNANFNTRAKLLTNAGQYDGLRVPITGETTGEGVYVMDIEGWLTIKSKDDDFDTPGSPPNFVRHAGSLDSKAGIFRMPTLRRDYADREVFNAPGSSTVLGFRPLELNLTYSRYDRPTILTNASLDFVNLNYHHDDISRDVTTDPATAQAAIVGGEKATFRKDVKATVNPDIAFLRPYNSNIHLHESLCMSGVRMVMREYSESTDKTFTSTNAMIFYNHGDALDTTKKGYGRVLMLGTAKNEVAAGGTSDYLKNSYIHTFRHFADDLDTLADLTVSFSLKTGAEFPVGGDTTEKAMQVLMLGNASYMDFGWSTTKGITKDNAGTTVYPWDRVALTAVDNAADLFDINSDSESAATLDIEGDLFYFGCKDASGNGSPSPVTATDQGCVMYMNHGSRMMIGSDSGFSPAKPYNAFSDVTIASKVWRASESGLNTQLTLPGDQMKLKNPIQPYGIDWVGFEEPAGAGLLTANKYLSLPALTGNGLGSQIQIAWDKVKPSPGIQILGYSDAYKAFEQSRSTFITTAPTALPTQGLIKLSTGDYLEQLSVSGATAANPFAIYLSGDDTGIAQVREIISAKSDHIVPGEGANAKIFMDSGARIGLGVRDWNDNSEKAWNLLGKSAVALRPNGNCMVDVNSDLVVIDPQPIIPTTNFGSSNIENRISFFSHDTHEIRVPAGGELDLSAFGQPTSTTNSATQQVAIGGKLRLIFEPGSTLRFPDLTESSFEHYPVLYMNEESELIFEGVQDLEGKTAWNDTGDTDRAKIKIIGSGQIWVNKKAKMIVNDGAIVAVEADATTQNSNLTVSIQREGELLIGDANHSGGSLQVGNPVTVTGAKIGFTLRLNSPNSFAHIGRAGFLGFGVGTIDRSSSKSNNWTMQSLKDVKTANIRLIKGTINHNNIYDGASKESSVMAFGPLTAASSKYIIEVGPTEAVLRGGANNLYVTTDSAPGSLLDVNILSTVVALDGTSADNGKYNLAASTVQLSQVSSVATQDGSTTIGAIDTTYQTNNLADEFDSADMLGGFAFRGNQADVFKYMGQLNFKSQTPSAFVALGKTQFEYRIGYVLAGAITRTATIPLLGITSPEGGLLQGALKAATVDASGNPAAYTIP